jgi:hypothetical protein
MFRRCRNPCCQYRVHSDPSLVVRFCCRACRLSFAKAYQKASGAPDTAADVETLEILQRHKCSGDQHGIACQQVQFHSAYETAESARALSSSSDDPSVATSVILLPTPKNAPRPHARDQHDSAAGVTSSPAIDVEDHGRLLSSGVERSSVGPEMRRSLPFESDLRCILDDPSKCPWCPGCASCWCVCQC